MKTYSKFHFGIQDGIRLQRGFADLQNCDIHTELGAVTGKYKLETESGSIVTSSCYSAVAPNGDTYFFSSENGDIFKRTQDGTYSSIRTNPNGEHKGCVYYNGYIYYSTNTRLGRFDLNTTWVDDFQTLLAEANHSMEQFDLILYICNGNNIASVDDTGVFTSSALDLPTQYEAVALQQFGDDLLVLGNADYITDSKIFRWTTYSDSWSISDPIKEPVFAFIDADNYVFVVAVSGRIYQFSGRTLSPVFKVPAYTNYNAQLTTTHKGKALVANGNKIYSIFRKSVNTPFTLCGEYTATGTIKSIVASGDDLLVSSSVVENIGTDRANAVITSPLYIKPASQVEVSYYNLPTGTSIEIETKCDNGNWEAQTEIIDDEDWKKIILKDDILNKRDLQVRVTLVASGGLSPEIDKIIIQD